MLRNVASDLAGLLEAAGLGLARPPSGLNLYLGALPEDDDETVPDTAVAIIPTGGASPEPYLGGARRQYLRATCQVLVRGPREDYATGQALAVGVWEALSLATLSPYVALRVREAAPFPLSRDDEDRGLWSLNVEAEYVSAP